MLFLLVSVLVEKLIFLASFAAQTPHFGGAVM